MRTHQQIFDDAATGVLAQGKPAKGENSQTGLVSCQYLTEDGRKCGIGQLLANDEIRTKWDGIGLAMTDVEGQLFLGSTHADMIRKDLAASNLPADALSLDLMKRIQSAHDSASQESDFVALFKNEMRLVAQDFDLDAGKVQ